MIYKSIVISTHIIIILLATLISLGGMYNLSSPDPSTIKEVHFAGIIVYNILVVISCFIQLRLKKIWFSVCSLIVLVVAFFFKPHVVMYIEGLLR